jgi:hypothetical protein
VFVLIHVPPPLLIKLVVDPTQTEVDPVIAAGKGLTVTVVVYTVAGLQPDPILLSVSE